MLGPFWQAKVSHQTWQPAVRAALPDTADAAAESTSEDFSAGHCRNSKAALPLEVSDVAVPDDFLDLITRRSIRRSS